MMFFPQLSSGALSHYPVAKRLERRTIATAHAGGTVWKLGDQGANAVRWRLHYQDLTTEEAGAIAALFEAAEGRLRCFTFLDPAGNLLTYSEELSRAPWIREPLLDTVDGIRDPEGGSKATRLSNTGQAPQRIEQCIHAPAQFQYCISFQARSALGATVTSIATSGEAAARLERRIAADWVRVVHHVQLPVQGDTINFGLETVAGQTLEVFAMQVEAQAGASRYRPTHGAGGVYSEARFDDDALALTADGPGRYSCNLRIVARVEG